jgi:hypothetical protein
MNSLTSPSARFQSEIEPAWNEYLSDSLVERKANNLARAIRSSSGLDIYVL